MGRGVLGADEKWGGESVTHTETDRHAVTAEQSCQHVFGYFGLKKTCIICDNYCAPKF